MGFTQLRGNRYKIKYALRSRKGRIFEPMIPRTIDELERLKPKCLIPCHCSGLKVINEIVRNMPLYRIVWEPPMSFDAITRFFLRLSKYGTMTKYGEMTTIQPLKGINITSISNASLLLFFQHM